MPTSIANMNSEKEATESSQETIMSDDFSKLHTGRNGVSSNANSASGDAPHSHAADQPTLLESMSAMMDDHADDLELRRVLKAMPVNAELAAKWERFHTVRSYLQQEMHSRPAVNLLDGINARLAAESITLPKYTTNRLAHPMLRYVGQGAIAASFFAMTIIVTSMFNQSATNGTGAELQSAVADAATNLDTPVLGGEYKGSELSRTASLEGTLDEAALARLRQAVYQEFSGNSPTPEIPVSYTLDLPAPGAANP